MFKSLLRKSYSICFEFLYRIHEAIVNEEDGELESYLLDLDFRYVRQNVNQIWYKSIGVNILFTDQNVWSSFLSSVLWYDAKNTKKCDVTLNVHMPLHRIVIDARGSNYYIITFIYWT